MNGRHKHILLLTIAFVVFTMQVSAQNILINTAMIDGDALTPDNILAYQVHSTKSCLAIVKGTIRYRNSNLSASYSFHTKLNEGNTVFDRGIVHPQWVFSSPALQDLFLTYKMLPEGTYEYCVSVVPDNVLPENAGNTYEECIYHKPGNLFLINLIDPEDKAVLHEYFPSLSWVANYSFSTMLSYRLRIAEIKQGQNAVNAVMRNQPIFDGKSLMQNSIIYPVYAKPLLANKPYAWTVDAYYKDILLGSSETWQFIIADDSEKVKKSEMRSYVDIKLETGLNKIVVIGNLKLKYVLDDAKTDTLALEILNEKNKSCGLSPATLSAVYGDNRYTLNVAEGSALKHKANYFLKITTKTKQEYIVAFQYWNPDFVR
ncbi:MAG: hypothetical protein V4649_02785 [Bacteroidota bacterium]